MNEEHVILSELPEKPDGWTCRMIIHMNFGAKGRAATYALFDDKGRRTSISYAYDTRGDGESGFFFNGSPLMSWKELRERFSELMAKKPESRAPER